MEEDHSLLYRRTVLGVSGFTFILQMLPGSKKKRAHPDSYDPPSMASAPLVTSTSSAVMSTPPAIASTPSHFVEAHPNFGKVSILSRIFAIQSLGKGFDGTRDMRVPYGTLGRNGCPLAKYLELTANVERLHIETGYGVLSDEQLIFEATGGSNKGYVYGFGSQSRVITAEQQRGSSSSSVPSVSYTTTHECCI
ncbi:hypothetical protein M9H77_12661 [Catharanthus roseus]|uniref:Uncharacterized protein n=1 Tax=Catharanthus roseus TaxID=4058 RepID=A0ACC0BI78_CATRO|nr:hypothetical protein M9H77_12661 [Catharanthus roseus]